MRPVPALLLIALVFIAAPARAVEPSAADTIAEKFAAASEARSSNAPDDKAAAARRKAQSAKQRAQIARAAAQRRELDVKRLRTQDEADMLARAKAEAAAHEAEQQSAEAEAEAARAEAEARQTAADAQVADAARKAETERRLEAEAQRRVAENHQREAAAKVAEAAAKDAADKTENDRRATLEAQREAETLKLAERLREARRAKAAELDQHEREAALQQEKDASDQPNKEAAVAELRAREAEEQRRQAAMALQQQAAAEAARAASAASTTPPQPPATPVTNPPDASTTRATVLLVLEPGDYGIRRFNRLQADPVLCLSETCYISQGPDTPARAMSRFQALGAGNTLGGRAGACKLQLSCVFRDVDLGPTGKAQIMPVDLHVLRHDRREVTPVEADRSCAPANGRLTCGMPVIAKTYRALIVPEATAATAGAAALTTALATLGSAQTAEAK